MMRRGAVLLFLSAFVSPLLAEEAPVLDPELGLSFRRPSGFRECPELRAQAGAEHVFLEDPAPPGKGPLLIMIRRLGRPITRSQREPAQIAAKFKEGMIHSLPKEASADVSYRQDTWRGFTLDGCLAVVRGLGDTVAVLAVEIPLRKEAVLLMVRGPDARQAESEELLKRVLGTLDGDSNWLSGDDQAEKIGEVVGGLIGIGVGVWVLRRLALRKSRAA